MAKKTFRFETDVTLPEVTVDFGGVELPLCYDLAAIVQVERETGINLFAAVVDEPSREHTVALLRAGLLRDSPDVTLEQATVWVTPRNWLGVLEAVRLAWLGSVPEAEDGAGDAVAGEVDAQAQP